MVVFGTTENRMASSIDSTKPATGSATTSSVRDNFALAKAEINELMRATEDIVTAAGTADALTADFVTNVVLAEGVTICIKAASANTSATPTLNVDGTGAKTIVKNSGSTLSAGDIAGSRHRLIFKYDASNTVWVLINPAMGGDSLYPVGSVYINASVATNPSTLLGFGTWAAFGAGRVMVGLDSGNALFDTVEETGGSADSIVPSHTHTASSAVTDPGHVHNVGADPSNGYNSIETADGGGGFLIPTRSAVTGISVATTVDSAGISATDTNYQPFITVYMWKRTA